MHHRTLLVVVALLAASTYFSTAHAQFDLGNAAVRATARGMATEVIQDAGAGLTTSKAVGWGARMFTRTNLVIAGVTLIPWALNYFYETMQGSTGTSLDDYVPGTSAPSIYTGHRVHFEPDPNDPTPEYVCNIDTTSGGLRWSGPAGVGEAACIAAALEYLNGATMAIGLLMPPYNWAPYDVGPLDVDTSNSHHQFFPILSSPEDGGSGSGNLYDFLDANPDAYAAMRDQVLPDTFDATLPDGAVPYTYAQPFGADAGATLDPAPTSNQYQDDPYHDPSLDSDGDGFKDWEEDQAGTDPSDPNSTPDASPDPNRDTDGDGYPDWYERDQGTDPNDALDFPAGDAPEDAPDADGDGVADANDPCPFSAANTCAANAEAETLAQEATLQDAVGVLEEIRDGTAANAYDFADPAPATFADPDLSPLQAWQPDLAPVTSSLDTAIQDIGAEFDPVFVAAEGTFPFGMTQLLLPPAGAIGSDCAPATLTIMGATETINVCDSPMDDFMVNTLRPILTALLTFGALWLVMGWIRSA